MKIPSFKSRIGYAKKEVSSQINYEVKRSIKKGSHFCEPLVLLVPAAGIELAT